MALANIPARQKDRSLTFDKLKAFSLSFAENWVMPDRNLRSRDLDKIQAD